jgi:hypothetical protein
MSDSEFMCRKKNWILPGLSIEILRYEHFEIGVFLFDNGLKKLFELVNLKINR